MPAGLEIQLTAILIAAACALPGAFLVLRRMSMLSDAITHTILLGIVLAFFVTRDLSSPLLLAGAAAMGVVTVWLTETLEKTRLVSGDSATGLVFPLLFSVAILLISRYAGSVHLDVDSVLLGELAFAPFDRLVLFGVDLGAKSLYLSGGLLLCNAGFLALFRKELQLAVFDPVLAAVLGFSPALLHYGLMALVSLTTVGAFQAVGSVLVVAFMIGPPAAAWLLTDELDQMLLLSVGIGAAGAVAGYQAAIWLDASIAGSMAAAVGLLFLLALFWAPERGVLSTVNRRRRQKRQFAQTALLLSLIRRPGTLPEAARRLCWSRRKLEQAARALQRKGWIEAADGQLRPTGTGQRAGKAAEAELLRRAE